MGYFRKESNHSETLILYTFQSVIYYCIKKKNSSSKNHKKDDIKNSNESFQKKPWLDLVADRILKFRGIPLSLALIISNFYVSLSSSPSEVFKNAVSCIAIYAIIAVVFKMLVPRLFTNPYVNTSYEDSNGKFIDLTLFTTTSLSILLLISFLKDYKIAPSGCNFYVKAVCLTIMILNSYFVIKSILRPLWMYQAEKKPNHQEILSILISFVVVELFICSTLTVSLNQVITPFFAIKDVTPIQCLYYVIMTFTTVGYGDITITVEKSASFLPIILSCYISLTGMFTNACLISQLISLLSDNRINQKCE